VILLGFEALSEITERLNQAACSILTKYKITFKLKETRKKELTEIGRLIINQKGSRTEKIDRV